MWKECEEILGRKCLYGCVSLSNLKNTIVSMEIQEMRSDTGSDFEELTDRSDWVGKDWKQTVLM